MRRLDVHTAGAAATASPAQANARLFAWMIVAAAILLVLALFAGTVRSIVDIWARSQTFTHGFFVVPIVLWLCWRRREELAATPLAPCPAALAGVALAALGWLVAQQVGVLGGQQFMLVTAIVSIFWALAGTAVVRVLAFPLAYLFLAVPFGEFLVPTLMDWTADFAIAALRASGIPVFREGMNFAIPNSRWSVIEECSGINYLIASIAIGTLYANVNFHSLRRRLAFVALSVAVPLVANGVRVYLIVIVAYLSNNRFGMGFDHLLLGWLLYGAVMLAMFWGGLRFADAPPAATPGGTMAGTASPARLVAIGVIGVALASLAPLTVTMLDRPGTALDGGLALPAGAQGWSVDEHPLTDWTPEFLRPSASAARTYVKDGRRVGAAIVLYRTQNREHQLITSTNQVVHSTNPRWRILTTGRRPVDLGGNHVLADTLEFSDARGAIVAWHWYWIDGRATASGILGKVYQLLAKLQGHADGGALVVLFARADAGADAALADFARSMGPAIDDALLGAVAAP